MDAEGVEHAGFKGFVANRFGRKAEMAKEFLARKKSFMNFFDATVDAKANKLVFAVSISEIYKELGEFIIFPLIALGFDNQAPQSAHHRSWTGAREFFRQKLVKVVKRQGELTNSNKKDCLLAAVLSEVIDC